MEYGKTHLCPKCGKKFLSSEEGKAFLPFCSKKCKMIDLGKWLQEKYVVEETEPSPHKNTDNNDSEE